MPTKRTAARPPAAAPTKPQLEPTPYGPSTLAMFHRVYSAAEEEEREFLHEFLSKCLTSPSVADAALEVSAKKFDVVWFGNIIEDHDSHGALQYLKKMHQVQLLGGWVTEFLHSIINHWHERQTLTPEDVLPVVHHYAEQFQTSINIARGILANHGSALAADVRAFVRRDPSVLEVAANDR